MATELQVHIGVVFWLRKNLADGALFFHCPNGEYRTPSATAKFRALGVYAGVADLTVFTSGVAHFIEFKSETGRLSREQELFRDWAMEAGIEYRVVRTLDEAKQILRNWGAVRETVPMAE
jgi:VRR-NUC domain